MANASFDKSGVCFCPVYIHSVMMFKYIYCSGVECISAHPTEIGIDSHYDGTWLSDLTWVNEEHTKGGYV